MRDCYGFAGRELSAEAEAAMRDYLATNKGDRHGKFRYSTTVLTDIGEDLDALHEEFRPFRERFGVADREAFLAVHSRVSLHQVAFLGRPTEAFVEHCRSLEVQHMTLVSQAFPLSAEAWRAVRRGGPRVTTVNHVFAVHPDIERDSGEAGRRLLEVVDVAAELGAERCIC